MDFLKRFLGKNSGVPVKEVSVPRVPEVKVPQFEVPREKPAPVIKVMEKVGGKVMTGFYVILPGREKKLISGEAPEQSKDKSPDVYQATLARPEEIQEILKSKNINSMEELVKNL